MILRKPFLSGLALCGLVSLLLAVTPASAQIVGKITFSVVDDQGNPLKGAKVYVKDAATNVAPRPGRTNAKGRITYTSMAPGSYIFWAELDGYMMAREVATITTPNGKKSVQTYFFDAKQVFDKPVHTMATGGITQAANDVELLMTTPDKHTAVVNKLYAEFQGLDTEGSGEAAKPEAPKEKSNRDKGMEFMANENYGAAIPFLKLAADEVKDDQDLTEVNYQLGKAMVETNDLTGAEAALKKAQELDPTKPGVSFYLARIYNEQGRKEDAIKELEQELQISPGTDTVLQNLAGLYKDTGQTQKAIDTYEGLIAANPENFEAYQALANLYKEAGDRQKEEEVYKRMGDKDPTGQSFYNLGNIAFNKDDREKAKFYYERVLEKNPKHAMAHYQLANTLLGMGDLKGAVEHFEAFAKLKPNDPKAAEARNTAKALKEMLASGSS